ncbi:hypothetical protein NDU88_001015 [Pleurodeles waltl]|uniref:Uncharacterized protein n=1 Tax=Pleurodeles waltl TaxID=8319 RepID=A0AAV7UTI2_PLEWA|nr:hypothetical protein NDU88_001015 [Pleurodeles waltl]
MYAADPAFPKEQPAPTSIRACAQVQLGQGLRLNYVFPQQRGIAQPAIFFVFLQRLYCFSQVGCSRPMTRVVCTHRVMRAFHCFCLCAPQPPEAVINSGNVAGIQRARISPAAPRNPSTASLILVDGAAPAR